MILQDYIGTIGTSTPYKSRALSHEVGHWLDLGHPWNRTINISINVGLACGDDGVDDTPTTKGHQTCPDLLTPDCKVDILDSAIFTFSGVTTSSGTSDPSPLQLELEKLNITPFKASGLSTNATVNGAFAFKNWTTGAPDGATTTAQLTGDVDPAKYYEITIQPKSGNSMSLKGIGLNVMRSATGPRTFCVRSSVDNFSSNRAISLSNPALSNTAGVVFFQTDNSDQQPGTFIPLSSAHTEQSITIRIYAFNAEDTQGSFAIDSVWIDGSAGVQENISNHMEYSYCTNMFTIGQRDRMRVALESPISGRSNLWSDANLIATGVTTPALCTPLPDFYVNQNSACAGASIKFFKTMSNAAETSLNWSFEGGTPATSTVATPTIKYNTPGIYQVSLTATNAQGSNTTTKVGYITIDDIAANYTIGWYNEGLENAAVVGTEWTVTNYDNNANTWSWKQGAGTSGSNAVVLNGYNSYNPDKDDFTSPSFDVRGNTAATFSFKYAAATRTAPDKATEELTILFSTDCGETWQPRSKIKSATLFNNGKHTDAFTTDENSVWTTKSMAISSAYQVEHLLIKLQFQASDSSNNMYIDDINLSTPNGIMQQPNPISEWSLYPNPATGQFTVKYSLENNATVGLELCNLLGQAVFTTSESPKTGGVEHELSIKTTDLPSGVYFIKLTANGHVTSKKVLVQ